MLLVVGIVLYSTLVQYVHSMLIIIMNNRVFSLHNRNFWAKRVIFSKPQEERDISSKHETKAGSAMGRKKFPPPPSSCAPRSFLTLCARVLCFTQLRNDNSVGSVTPVMQTIWCYDASSASLVLVFIKTSPRSKLSAHLTISYTVAFTWWISLDCLTI